MSFNKEEMDAVIDTMTKVMRGDLFLSDLPPEDLMNEMFKNDYFRQRYDSDTELQKALMNWFAASRSRSKENE